VTDRERELQVIHLDEGSTPEEGNELSIEVDGAY
jgi:hypothetical protein